MSRTAMIRRAALAQACVTLAGLVIGVSILLVTGAHDATLSGVGAERIVVATPLMVAAEVTKLAGAVAFGVLAIAAGGQGASVRKQFPLVAGCLAAILLSASGLAGLAALHTREVYLGGVATACGLASLAAAGVFSLALIANATPPLSRGLRLLGSGYAIAAIAASIIPPVAMIAALLGLGWWFWLASRSGANRVGR